MFEYMSAGLPVIASHFPLWKNIITHNQCGLCVDPLDPQAIWSAISEITSNPEKEFAAVIWHSDVTWREEPTVIDSFPYNNRRVGVTIGVAGEWIELIEE